MTKQGGFLLIFFASNIFSILAILILILFVIIRAVNFLTIQVFPFSPLFQN